MNKFNETVLEIMQNMSNILLDEEDRLEVRQQ
jgi:hypothetical protein